ncbi:MULTISPECIES: glycosyltransferase family 4 protein [Providencia]|uniref:glycosyltransferase family 4 protein n=1 Tax=Providencia TaxID=586 RepID=UPI00197F27DC|nr:MULTISPECIES: glycosyltransferase family 4 protein [Providencia]HEC8328283.1 glycosyltransferase family 4 protein [Providencia rettgeri]MBN4866470.1 glycosyltransferase family 4 protein [Providencia stuartii]MBN4875792.1 glycosyltransferase family 4 protein [Providencia stuartii]MBN4880484.1 glycosyltransferase family 4 protein [Providencia stuartii]MBN4884992.1 glycosyltransferase family 4 protein [Providencia stuartii]
MKLAFCLYKYFPFGGLQRDFLRIATECQSRGHHIRVYTQSWEGEKPDGFEVVIVPVSSSTNHGRNAQYCDWVLANIKQHPVDRIVGFNKMPGLDVYYAADVCYAQKVAEEKGFFYKLTPRYKHYAAFEKAVFDVDKPTQLLMLTPHQIKHFKKHYQTEDVRFHMLPPGIALDRKYDKQITDAKRIYRQKNQIPESAFLLLQVGSDFKRKGVDRTLRALAALPENIKKNTLLMVVGQDKPSKYQQLAQSLGISQQVSFFSGRNDIAELMAAADILMHPAYQEAAGIVLLEAITAGLPIIVTEVCGYASFIQKAQCGVVINEPFEQSELNYALQNGLEETEKRMTWVKNAQKFADTEDLYSLPQKAADIILGCQND